MCLRRNGGGLNGFDVSLPAFRARVQAQTDSRRGVEGRYRVATPNLHTPRGWTAENGGAYAGL